MTQPVPEPAGSDHGIPTSNSFEMLTDYGEISDDNNEEADPTTVPTADAAAAVASKTPPAGTKVRCPPIFAYGSSVNELNRMIAGTSVTQLDYHLRVSKSHIQVSVKTKPHFLEVVGAMKASHTRFYTHGTSDEIPVKVVLSGLPAFSVEEVKQELEYVNIVPTSVRLLATAKQGDYSLFLLQFPRGTVKLQDLQKTKALFNVIVRWRYYEKKKQDVIQCFRCQDYGHGMRNCQMQAKCVKCGELHQTKDCTIPARADTVVSGDGDGRSQIRCANCSQNHTANYKGCPTRLKYLKDLEAAKKRRPTARNNIPRFAQLPKKQDPASRVQTSEMNKLLTSITNPGTSYSQALQSPLQSEPSNLFTVEEFMGIAHELFERLSNCNTKAMQFLALAELMVKNKTAEFFLFLESHEIDIAVVTETWLQLNNSLYHQNYKIVRMDRDSPVATRGGGVAVLVREGITFTTINISSRAIEAVGVSIQADQAPVNIVAVYYPGSTRRATLCQFRRDIRQLSTIEGPYFLVGDLNARHRMWNCSKANKAGRILHQEYESSEFFIHAPGSHTRFPSGRGRPATLDLVISNNIVQMSVPEVHVELSSDHLPVTFTIEADHPTAPAGRVIRCYDRANWNVFSRTIREKVDLTADWIAVLDRPSKIDEAVEKITEIIKSAEEAAVPSRRITRKKEDFPDELKLLIRLRNVRRRQYMRRRDPLLGAVVGHLNNVIQTKSTEHRYRNFGSMLRNMDNGSNKFWKLTRNLRNTVKYSPPLKVEGTLVVSPSQKAEALATAFAAAHNNTEPGDAETSAAVTSISAHVRATSVPVPHSALVKPCEVKSIIRSIRNRKAPGLDGIRNTGLKHLPRKGLVALTKIFNACLTEGYFPNGWKHAIVTAIPKANKDITNPTNYRPISLLCGLSKVLERILLSRMNQQLDLGETIPHEQFGFKKGHSTVHQLARITQKVRRGFLAGKSTGMVLLDVEKAYDSVWQDAVVYKLHNANFQPYLVRAIQSFLSNRSFAVTVNGVRSSVHTIPFGVPQGSVLSPTLYNILTSDVPKVNGVTYAYFADDTAYMASDKDPQIVVTHLQAAQNRLEHFQKKWRIKLNAGKTQSIFFTKKRAPRHFPRRTISVNGHPTTWDNDVKYLGVVLDQKLKFDKHVNHIVDKVGRSTKALYSLVNRRSRLHIKNKSLVFKCIVRPMLTYASAVWGSCAKTHRKRLQVKQNKLLKMIHNLDPWYPTEELHKLAGVETIDASIERSSRTFWTSCVTSANPLIEALTTHRL